jgi:hypothetical protein
MEGTDIITPEKASQTSAELRDISARIIKIAEEMASLESTASTVSKPVSLEDVRGVLADISRAGRTDKVRELLLKHGAPKLSEIDPGKYAALLADAEAING